MGDVGPCGVGGLSHWDRVTKDQTHMGNRWHGFREKAWKVGHEVEGIGVLI